MSARLLSGRPRALGAEGRLCIADIVNGHVLRVTDAADFMVFSEYDGMACGFKFDRDGRIFLADFEKGLV